MPSESILGRKQDSAITLPRYARRSNLGSLYIRRYLEADHAKPKWGCLEDVASNVREPVFERPSPRFVVATIEGEASHRVRSTERAHRAIQLSLLVAVFRENLAHCQHHRSDERE
jgi:hypothetical protein